MDASTNFLFYVGAVLFVAFVAKFLFSDRLHFPAVTIYVILGVVVGMSVLRIFPAPALASLDFLTRLGVGLIAFVIGSELDARTLRQLGRSIIVIACLEASLAFLFVAGTVYLFFPGKPEFALILGAVASATAPAATVYVIRQFKAKGPLTSTIMGVVGIDDAFALIIYVFASLFAEGILKGEGVNLVVMITRPFITIGESVGVGLAAGLLCYFLLRKVRDPENLRMASFAMVVLLLGVSDFLNLSELLTIMSFGILLTNSNLMLGNRTRTNLEALSPVILPLFFILAGAHLNVGLILQIGLLGLAYTGARALGKISGATLGALVGGAQKSVRRYIGFSLVPQVGVAIALALAVQNRFGGGRFGPDGNELASLVINILLFTTLITEVAGPLLTKASLTAAGEIQEGGG